MSRKSVYGGKNIQKLLVSQVFSWHELNDNFLANNQPADRLACINLNIALMNIIEKDG